MNHLSKVGRRAGKDAKSGDIAGRYEQSIAVLKRCNLFNQLESDTLNEILASSTLGYFPRRKQIYVQGQKGVSLFVISFGRVRLAREIDQQRVLTVAYRGSSEIIGETALLSGSVYCETVTATEYVETICIPLTTIEKLLQKGAKFALYFVQMMIERNLEAEQRVENLLSRSVESRIVDFLVNAASRYGIPESRGMLIGTKYTHQEIADFVGSTRETVTIILGELKRKGLIQVDHRRLIVSNQDALERLV